MLCHIARELVRLANSVGRESAAGDKFDGNGAIVLEDEGGHLFRALSQFHEAEVGAGGTGAYERVSSHLPELTQRHGIKHYEIPLRLIDEDMYPSGLETPDKVMVILGWGRGGG